MSSYFRLRHSRSMNTLSIHRPRPSIEIVTPAAARVPVKAALVNWLPWSVLKILRLAEARQGLLERRDAERYIHGVGEPPAEHRPARPVDHRDEVEKAAPNRHIG